MENKFAIPGAILIAGIIIAGAVFYTNKNAGPGGSNNGENGNTQATDLSFKPVDEEDHILGNPNADVVIVEYSDFECPFCKNFHDTMHEIIDEYGEDGRVAWVYRHFPLAVLHSKAPEEARASECAAELGGNTGFWAFADTIYATTPSNDGLDLSTLPDLAASVGLDRAEFEECLDSERYKDDVDEDFQSARAAGGSGTPYSTISLSEELSQDAAQSIAMLGASFSDSIRITNDRMNVVISGALPIDAIRDTLDILLFDLEG